MLPKSPPQPITTVLRRRQNYKLYAAKRSTLLIADQMKLTDPIAAYNAESNMDALMAQRYLEAEGIEAFAVEDNSLVGYWMFGKLPEIHKPQVWVNRCDTERAGRLLAEYERRKNERDAARKANEPKTIEVQCEDCSKPSIFSGSLNGTVQECPHCGSYIDVGEFEWPDDHDFGDTEENGDAGI